MSELDYRFTIDDLANKFNVTPETVRRWCRSGLLQYKKLPGVKGEFRFSQKDIEDFLDSLQGNDIPVKETLFEKKKK